MIYGPLSGLKFEQILESSYLLLLFRSELRPSRDKRDPLM